MFWDSTESYLLLSILYFLSIYVIFVTSGHQIFYSEFQLNKKSCLHTSLEFTQVLRNQFTWPLNTWIFFRLRWASSPSWYNLVFLFINWLLYNSKSSIPNGSVNPFERTTSLIFLFLFCNGSRISHHPAEPFRQSSGQYPRRTIWTCWCNVRCLQQWGSYSFQNFYSTSHFFLFQGPLHNIYESIHRNDADPSLGTYRALRAPTKS